MKPTLQDSSEQREDGNGMKPALQVQFPMETLAAGDAESAGHPTHVLGVCAAKSAEYFPIAHFVQADVPVSFL